MHNPYISDEGYITFFEKNQAQILAIIVNNDHITTIRVHKHQWGCDEAIASFKTPLFEEDETLNP